MSAAIQREGGARPRCAGPPTVDLATYLSPDFGPRRRILDAATRLFRQRGFTNVSMNELAQEVGLSKPGLYHHWASKDALLMTIVGLAGEILLDHLDDVRREEVDPVRRLHAYVTSRLRTVADHQDLFAVMWQERANVASGSFAELTRHAERYRTGVRQLIDDAKRAGGVKPEIDSHLLMLALDGMTGWAYFWFRPDGDQPPKAIGDAFWQMLGSGILTGVPSVAGTVALEVDAPG